MRGVALALLLIIAASPAAAETDYALPRPLTEAERATGEAMIDTAARYLVDIAKEPESVRFRRVHLRTNLDPTNGQVRIGVCGETNGRNSYGGYTGWRTFSYARGALRFGENECPATRGWYDGRDYAPELTQAFAAASR